jgi:putative nucleotidyltransferase with HDIG domain
MNTLKPEQVLACLHSLPALPAVVTDLLASFDNEDVDVGALARQIARDQALAARLLRVANSSFYGLQTRISSINEAVVVLGFRAVRSMVIAVGVGGVFRAEQCPGFGVQAHIRHGVGVGLAARALALATRRNPEIAFTGGILHDIGKLVLASCFSPQYQQALTYRERHDCPVVVAERDVLGLDHAIVGGLLADAWRFPPALRSALAEHHSPAAATADSLSPSPVAPAVRRRDWAAVRAVHRAGGRCGRRWPDRGRCRWRCCARLSSRVKGRLRRSVSLSGMPAPRSPTSIQISPARLDMRNDISPPPYFDGVVEQVGERPGQRARAHRQFGKIVGGQFDRLAALPLALRHAGEQGARSVATGSSPRSVRA